MKRKRQQGRGENRRKGERRQEEGIGQKKKKVEVYIGLFATFTYIARAFWHFMEYGHTGSDV